VTSRFIAEIILVASFAALASCGGPGHPAETPIRGPDVVIPQVSEEHSKPTTDDPPAPVGTRDPIPSGGEGLEDDPEPGSEMDPWGSYASGTARGGPDCDRAADCCRQLYQQTGDPSVQRVCSSLRLAPSSLCANVLTSFQQAAPSMGLSCP